MQPRIDKVPFVFTEDSLSIVLIATVFVEHLFFGGNRADISLVFALIQASMLGYALLTRFGQHGLQSLKGWDTTSALFLFAMVAILCSLAPLPFGGNPIWREVGLHPKAAINPLGVWIEATKLLGYASVFTLAAICSATPRRGLMLMRFIVYAAGLFGLICLGLHFLSPVEVMGWKKPLITRYRLSGLFSSPNTAATVFGLNALIAVGALMRADVRVHRKDLVKDAVTLAKLVPLEILSFLISVQCLLLTSSRGGIASFVAALMALLIWRIRSTRGGGGRVTAILLGALGVIALISGGFALDRYLHAAVGKDLRLTWALLTWRIFTSAPLEGYGLGSLPQMFQSLTTQGNFAVVGWAGAAHNVYLQWLAEGGLLAAIPMIGLFVWLFKDLLTEVPKEGPSSIWRPALLSAILLILLHSFVEYSLQEPSIAAFFSILLGASLGFATHKPVKRRSTPASASQKTDQTKRTASGASHGGL